MKIILIIIFVLGSIYLLQPLAGFPKPPSGALRSTEPADTETILRQAYFTNLSRAELMSHYHKQFAQSMRLDLPPEDAQSIIRDQTKSSWLEELVHPLRESVYINGFFPTKPTEQINIDGIHYLNKVTVHYFPSHPVTRLTVLGLALISFYFLAKEYAHV